MHCLTRSDHHYFVNNEQASLAFTMCYVKFKQTNQIPHLSTLANQSTLNKGHEIEITKACTVAFMKARNSLVVQCREKHVNWKKTEDGENLFFKALANRF